MCVCVCVCARMVGNKNGLRDEEAEECSQWSQTSGSTAEQGYGWESNRESS